MTDIRFARAADHEAVVAIAAASDLFSSDELPYFADSLPTSQDDARLLFIETGDQPAGAAMLAPEAMSDNVWNLLFIGVDRRHQRSGVGRALVAAVEDAARTRDGRLMLIDTASGEDQAAARAFYLALGYRQEAVIADFYGDGVDRVTFSRKL